MKAAMATDLMGNCLSAVGSLGTSAWCFLAPLSYSPSPPIIYWGILCVPLLSQQIWEVA